MGRQQHYPCLILCSIHSKTKAEDAHVLEYSCVITDMDYGLPAPTGSALPPARWPKQELEHKAASK